MPDCFYIYGLFAFLCSRGKQAFWYPPLHEFSQPKRAFRALRTFFVKNLKVVYLADDDQDDRFFIRQAIREAGAQVRIIEAENGLELLELIQQEKHLQASLVLLDMNMPKMNGLETIAALRADVHFAKVPVVMISTSSHLSLVETAYQAGVDDFFVKPSSMEEFNTLGHKLIAQFHL